MGLRMKNFNIMGVHWKIRYSGMGVTKNQYIGGTALKGGGGAWTVRRFKGGLPKKRGWSFWGGGTKPKYIYCPNQTLKLKNCTLGWEVLYYFHTHENLSNKLQNIRRSKNLSYLARYRVMTNTRCRGMNSVRVLKYLWRFFNIMHELVTQSLSLS